VIIVHHRARLIASYNMSWQGKDGQRHWIVGSVQCHFLGERISRIGEALPTKPLRELLEAQQSQTTR
jgi:hypothetical protein